MIPTAPDTSFAALDQVKAFIERFASLMVAQDYAGAHGLLIGAAAAEWTPASLKDHWLSIVDDPAGLALMPELTAVDAMADWPDRLTTDAGWGYVPVVGAEINEAVSGVVQSTAQGLGLRTLELGRP